MAAPVFLFVTKHRLFGSVPKLCPNPYVRQCVYVGLVSRPLARVSGEEGGAEDDLFNSFRMASRYQASKSTQVQPLKVRGL